MATRAPDTADRRRRWQLPPATEPAISHAATRAAIRRRFVFIAVLVPLALVLCAGAVPVIRERSASERELLQTGVVVSGRVIAQGYRAKGTRWTDWVEWTHDGRRYVDRETLKNDDREELPPIGAEVPVIFEPTDPSWAYINGVFTRRDRHRFFVGLLLVPACAALLISAWLGVRGRRLWAVASRAPWQLAIVASVDRVLRANGRHKHTDVEIVGDDQRLPVVVRDYEILPGKPVWIALGDDGLLVSRPGAVDMRYRDRR